MRLALAGHAKKSLANAVVICSSRAMPFMTTSPKNLAAVSARGFVQAVNNNRANNNANLWRAFA